MTDIELKGLSREELEQLYTNLKNDQNTLIEVVVNVLKLLAILPYKEGDNVLNKLTKKASSIIFQSAIDPKGVAKDFECVQKLLPLMSKYVDQNGNIIKIN